MRKHHVSTNFNGVNGEARNGSIESIKIPRVSTRFDNPFSPDRDQVLSSSGGIQRTERACFNQMYRPSALIRAGQPGQIVRITRSHCTSFARNLRAHEYSTE